MSRADPQAPVRGTPPASARARATRAQAPAGKSAAAARTRSLKNRGAGVGAGPLAGGRSVVNAASANAAAGLVERTQAPHAERKRRPGGRDPPSAHGAREVGLAGGWSAAR